jgi:guanylate kinase
MKGLLLVVTAPSGAGKSSLIDALLKADPQLRLSVSYTTRAPRPGEQNGSEYHFVDEAAFLAMLERGEFLESAQVHGNRYGTSQAVIRQALARGEDLVLEIDWQGAQQVRRLHPDCIGVFILPPSVEELERRMASAEEEISHAPEFDYAIINSNFDEATRDLQAIIRVERLKRGKRTP